MQIKTNELINFTHYCSENSLKFPSERISNLIKFLQKKQHDNFERDISFIYSLLPSNREEKEKLKELIQQYFNLSIAENNDEYSFLSNYEDERIKDFFNDNSISRFQKLADDIIKDFESNYAVKDKQDLLAMCALQLSSRIESSENKKNDD